MERRREQEPALTDAQAVILVTGMQLEANGLIWWRGKDMVDALHEKKEIHALDHSHVYVDLKALEGMFLIESRSLHAGERKGLGRKLFGDQKVNHQYHVSEEGRKMRGGLGATDETNLPNLVPSLLPEFG